MKRLLTFLFLLFFSFAAQAKDVEEISFDDERFADVVIDIRYRDAPYYPYSCTRGKAGRSTDEVYLIYDIESNGRPTNIRIDKTTDECFNLVARRTLKDWRYTKPTYQGRPVKLLNVETCLTFILEDYGE